MNNLRHTVLTQLTEHFKPKKNVPFERHVFRQAAQQNGETVDSYITRLRTLAKNCEFADSNEAIRDQIVEKCSSGRLRRRLLRETDLTLDTLIQIAKLFESSERQADQIEKPENQTAPA